MCGRRLDDRRPSDLVAPWRSTWLYARLLEESEIARSLICFGRGQKRLMHSPKVGAPLDFDSPTTAQLSGRCTRKKVARSGGRQGSGHLTNGSETPSGVQWGSVRSPLSGGSCATWCAFLDAGFPERHHTVPSARLLTYRRPLLTTCPRADCRVRLYGRYRVVAVLRFRQDGSRPYSTPWWHIPSHLKVEQ
jgi:hypothetical protein